MGLTTLHCNVVCAVVLLVSATTAHPQGFPSRPIHMIGGFAAGVGVDTVARYLVDRMRETLGHPVVMENRAGALGNIAAEYVARANADGHTLFFTGNSTHAANIHLFAKIGFDPVKDFAPVATVASIGLVLIAHPAVPARNVAELTELARRSPGKLSYGSGNATGRVAAEMYRQMAGIEALHVPYKGVPTALADLLSGQIQFLFADSTTGINQSRSGKARALAVTNPQRLAAAPDIPTMAESGLAGYDLVSWLGVFAPAATPREVVARLAETIQGVVASPAAREFLAKVGAEPLAGGPDALAKLVERDTERYGRIIRATGMKAE